MSGPDGSTPIEIDPAEEAEAVRELRRVEADWLRRPGVTGVDVGLERRQGRPTGRVAVRVFVAQKRPLEDLPTEERLPERLGRVPVDVVEATTAPES